MLTSLRNGDEPLETLLGPGCFTFKVLTNLEMATFMDTTVVGWLIKCHARFRDSGGCLVLYAIPPLIDEIFQFLKLSAVLHLAADESAALTLAQR